MSPLGQNIDRELDKLRIDRAHKAPRDGGGKWIVLFILILAAGAGGWFYYQKAMAAVPVKVVRAERQDVSAEAKSGEAVLTAGGYVIPRHKVEVASKVIGRVEEMLVARGDKVEEGQVLIRIEDDEPEAQVAMAQARAQTLRAQVAEMEAGSRKQEIEAARAAVASAQATLKGAADDLERMRRLRESGVAAQQEFDRARTAHDVAQANVNSARKNLELVETWPRPEQLAAVRAQLAEAQANLAYAQAQLEYTVIRAPISGTILEKLAEKGELVTNVNFGGTRGAKSSVVSMADLTDLQVELDINENDLPKVRPDQPTEIRLDSNPDVVFTGKVDEIAPEADRQKATVEVKVRINNPNEAVRPEMNARVTFLEPARPAEAPRPDAAPRVWIPRSAVVQGAEGPSVYIASDGTAVARRVKLGPNGQRGVEVLDGLAGNELLIIEPLDKIHDGARIALEGAAASKENA